MATPTQTPAPSKPPGSAFPQKAALAALTATALLYAWHRLKDPTAGLSPDIFRQAAELRVPHAPVPASPTAPLNGIQQPANEASTYQPKSASSKPGTPAPISAVLVDDWGALDPFFASLYTLETHRKPEVVTILHYGDSPTTADLITGDARALLQGRFGDAGPGFNLIAKPWAWYGHRGVTVSDHGWKSLTGVGAMRQSTYGLGGATLVGGPDATSTLKLADRALTAADLQFLTEPNGGSVTVSADGNPLVTVSTDGPSDTPADRLIPLPPGTASLSLSVSGGSVKLAGIDLRRGNSGVLYDSLGLNGASTTVISRTFSPTAWAAELHHAAPSLVIINYGTNESTFASFVSKQYEPELRLAIAKLRSALPDVPILIMSPMDRGERGGLNEIHTMATIPEIISIQKRVAADLHCAFFDTFNAMGGDGTMSRWTSAKPRLVTADLIHPTPQGALIVAEQLISNLDGDYDRWKQTHGHGATNPVVPTAANHSSPVIPAGSTRSEGTRSFSTEGPPKDAVNAPGAQRSGEGPASVEGAPDSSKPNSPAHPVPQKPSAATPTDPPPPSPTSADPSNSSDTGGR